MKYRISFTKEKNNEVHEKIIIIAADGSTHSLMPQKVKATEIDDQYRPIGLQLLNGLNISFPGILENEQTNATQSVYTEHAGFLQILFSEFLLLPESRQHLLDTFVLDENLRANHHSKRYDIELHTLIGTFQTKNEIQTWIGSNLWYKMISNHELGYITVLCELIVSSERFLSNVKEFYRMKAMHNHRLNDGYYLHRKPPYYLKNDFFLKAMLLSDDYCRLGALQSLANFYLNNRKALNHSFSLIADSYLVHSLSIDVQKCCVPAKTEEITKITCALMEEENSDLEKDQFSSNLRARLSKLLNELESQEIYECDDYITLCGLSLYLIIKHNLPITRCSACGRYYVPRQDRRDSINYCFYPSPKNHNYSCSEYHSNFECSHPVTANRKPIKQKIDSVRTSISNIDYSAPLISFLNDDKNEKYLMRFVDFARGGLKVIDKHSITSDEAGENLAHYLDEIKSIQIFLNFFKKKNLRGKALTERKNKIHRISEEVDKCFAFDKGTWIFDAKYETWKSVMANISSIMASTDNSADHIEIAK